MKTLPFLIFIIFATPLANANLYLMCTGTLEEEVYIHDGIKFFHGNRTTSRIHQRIDFDLSKKTSFQIGESLLAETPQHKLVLSWKEHSITMNLYYKNQIIQSATRKKVRYLQKPTLAKSFSRSVLIDRETNEKGVELIQEIQHPVDLNVQCEMTKDSKGLSSL